MARANTVYLYGWLIGEKGKSPVRVWMDEKNKEDYLACKFYLLTIRNSYETDEYQKKGKIRWDNICVYTKNPDIIKHIVKHVAGNGTNNDMVFVKGTLCTKEVVKKGICPNCGAENIKDNGVIIYIDPVFVEDREKGLTEEEATKLLVKKREISNSISIEGTLCREPVYYRDEETGLETCQIQIASNRLRRIKEDAADKKTDYPWIKAYGPKTSEYAEVLHINSSIFLEGAIQTRMATPSMMCQQCGTVFERQEQSTDIVPYHIEYHRNCNIPENYSEDDEEVAE